ncbi:MAG: ABC transporter permease [Candidatus Moduliflexus flocculans]|nr:ABC transporter permease [Candidatus Moduliflexus flocculans]
MLAVAVGALLGLMFALVVVTFRAPQGIAGHRPADARLGHRRHPVPALRRRCDRSRRASPPCRFRASRTYRSWDPYCSTTIPLVYLAFLLVPVFWYILFKTPWGLKVRAVGTYPRAADSLGIPVARVRYQALALGGAMAGLAGAYLSLAQAKMFADDLVAGRGFIAVALVYFGQMESRRDHGGALLFSLAQALQLSIQVAGIDFPYEFAVMLPYALVIVVLALVRKARMVGPGELGKPFDREQRV